MAARTRLHRCAQALERQRGRHARGGARRPPAAHQRGEHAEQAVHQRGQRAPQQRRRHAREITTAQVAAQQAQRERGQRRAQGDAERAAQQAEQRRLGQHQAQPLLAREAQHAQQRELRLAPRDRQREHREHQERAGEQRHQRQHREVDPVGAREVAGALAGLFRALRDYRGRQCQRLQQGLGPGAGVQPQVDAAERAQPVHQRLRGGHVHHQQGRAGRVHAAGHPHGGQAQPALDAKPRGRHARDRQGLARGRVEEHRIGREDVQPPGRGVALAVGGFGGGWGHGQ
ncbi:hypothetical protein D9M68_724370 [compost metagenome]